MNRASPVVMRKCLEAVEVLRKAGVEFIAIPVVEEKDREELLSLFAKQIEKMDPKA